MIYNVIILIIILIIIIIIIIIMFYRAHIKCIHYVKGSHVTSGQRCYISVPFFFYIYLF